MLKGILKSSRHSCLGNGELPVHFKNKLTEHVHPALSWAGGFWVYNFLLFNSSGV